MDPGNVTIMQSYCVDSTLSVNSDTGGISCSNDTNLSPPVQSLTVTFAAPNASIVFDPPAFSYADVQTDIDIDGSQADASFASLTGTTSIDAPAPEPATIFLVPAGLLVGLLLRKSTRR
jgi:hypothetical protein